MICGARTLQTPRSSKLPKGSRKKNKITNLRAYVEMLEKKGVLVDWWEEGEDAVCFELKKEAFIKRE